MHSYIRSLAKSSGGLSEAINPYSSAKYEYAIKDPEVKKYIKHKIKVERKVTNWQRSRDDLFYLLKHHDARFESH